MTYAEAKCLCGASRISWNVEPAFKVCLIPFLPSPSPAITIQHTPIYCANWPLIQFRCHCTDENHLSGVGFSNNYYFTDSNNTLKVLSDNFSHYSIVVESKNNMSSHFCSKCGSLVYRSSSGFPGFALKIGNIDDGGKANKEYIPDIEIFTRSRAPWMQPVATAKQEVANFEDLSEYFWGWGIGRKRDWRGGVGICFLFLGIGKL